MVCSKEFVAHLRNPHQIYCTKDCGNKAGNENKIKSGKYKEYYQKNKENNSLRKKHISKVYYDKVAYGGNRKFILERDGYKCVKCGSVEKLHIHHIDESGQTENPNHEVDNLVTLCISCHGRLHLSSDNPMYKEVSEVEIIKYRKQGLSWIEVSKKLGVSYRTIIRKRKKYGILKGRIK